MTEDEKLIQEVQDQCEYFAKGIINSLCKRAIRKINSWNIHIGTDDYPSSFNFFNILSIEYQSKCYDEISPCLEDAIEGYWTMSTRNYCRKSGSLWIIANAIMITNLTLSLLKERYMTASTKFSTSIGSQRK